MSRVESDISKVTAALSKMKPGHPLMRFITHIRFPRFKNLRPGTRIDFGFPVTALVGPNGCGKTSVLHALYGAPERKSTSDYWFSTNVDPIDSRTEDPQRFIYGHWLQDQTWHPTGGIVETRKALVRKEGDPDYWEPTKITVGDDMAPMPDAGKNPVFGGPAQRVRSLDRWSAVKRDVLYLNFRGELGAFDQYFWFGQLRRGATHTKQDEIRSKAALLKRAIDEGTDSLVWHNRRRVFGNLVVTKEDLETAGGILEKEYAAARIVEHDLYGGHRSNTAIFTASTLAYSEAFAGSGEMAVLTLVVKVRAQQKGTLILLDEPELSLHPGAQKRLLHFLMEECRKKQHQVVFTTHSPHLIEYLPPKAIKVFTSDASRNFSVLNEVHPYAAFNRLGATPTARVRILVEDRLAQHIVHLALTTLEENERSTFYVDFLPGGADNYLSYRIPTLMGDANTWLLLDGDQRRGESRPSSAIADDALDTAITQLVGKREIVYGADGGNDPASRESHNALKRKYLDYLHTRVRYLPRSCPEEVVLRATAPQANPATSAEAKKLLREELERLGLSPSSSDSDAQAQLLLAQRKDGNADLAEVAKILRAMLAETK